VKGILPQSRTAETTHLLIRYIAVFSSDEACAYKLRTPASALCRADIKAPFSTNDTGPTSRVMMILSELNVRRN
jgi:hypothetical protein